MAVERRMPLDARGATAAAVEGLAPRERRREPACRAAGLMLMLVGVLTSAPAAAQGPPDPPGPFVLDARAVLIGLPEVSGFFPVAAGLPVAGRALGFDLGAHVYAGRLGPARLGFGASFLSGGTEKSPPVPAPPPTATASSPTAAPPGVHVDLREIAPQLSFNFGTADGWSYLSTGVGLAEVNARTIGSVSAERSSGWLMTINVGGGARWFLTRRVAVGFDLRLHHVAAADAIPASLLFGASAGISLR